MAADTPSDSSASANTNTTADSPAPRREVLGDLHPGQVVEPDERGAGGKARRHCSRACRAIHDLARTLRLYVGWMDCSEEVLIAAQRIIETYSDGGDLQIAASLLIATKLVSLQQLVLPCSLVARCIGSRASELRAAELELCRAADWRFMHLCRSVHK